MMLPSDQDASGRTFDETEIAYVTEVLRSGTLTTTKGKFGKLLEQKFAEKFGAKYAYACTSGSAAIHIAVATVNPNPGDEIITPAVTFPTTLTPIVQNRLIPVFVENGITAYPNPFVDQITLLIYLDDADLSKAKEIEVYNSIGQKIKSISISELNQIQNEYQFTPEDINLLTKGIYLIQLKLDGVLAGTCKLIKK